MITFDITITSDASELRIIREAGFIELRHLDGHFSANLDDWREIIKQVSALLEPAKIEAAPAETPHPRGYVFIDYAGDAWGYAAEYHRDESERAERPFRTAAEAAAQGELCVFGCRRVEVWTPESRVPPMPEKRP